MLQHRHNLRCLTAPLSVQAFQIFAVTSGKHRLAKTPPFSRVNPPLLNKPLVTIIGQHLRPQISGITGGIPATKNMCEITAAIAGGIAEDPYFPPPAPAIRNHRHPALPSLFFPGNVSISRSAALQFAHLIPFIEQAGITHFPVEFVRHCGPV